MLQHGKRPTIASRHGMVAAAHPIAAAAGARVLSNGGNAFDAAAATAATLNIVEPYMSGLGGQGYATCYVASERRVRSLNFMARIPRHFPLDRLSRREQILRGPVAVGAPGNFGGWCEMVSRYGTKKLPELFAPAIRMARDGFGLIEFNVEEYRGVTGELRGQAALYPEWSRNYLGGIEGGQPRARRGAQATQPRQYARGARQRRPRPALRRRARQEGGRAPDRARRLPDHGRPRSTSSPSGSIRWR